MKTPAEGWARENCARVLPSSPTAIPAAIMVSGEATPAVSARNANPKKKLIAGPIFAIVAAAISTMPKAPDRNLSGSRAGSTGAFDSTNSGRSSVGLMATPLGPSSGHVGFALGRLNGSGLDRRLRVGAGPGGLHRFLGKLVHADPLVNGPRATVMKDRGYEPPFTGQHRACSLTASTARPIDLLCRPVSSWA